MESKKFKSIILQLSFAGIMIFLLGMFSGYQLNNGAIASIQGYLLNAFGMATSSNATSSNATSSNATSSNATSSNATSSNATSSNATSSNATSSNAAKTDNILYLQSFSLLNNSVTAGDKIEVSISTSGASKLSASIVFKNASNGATFTAQVNSINNNPYIIIPSNVVITNYNVTDVLLVGKNSDGSTFTKQFSSSNNINSTYFNFDSVLTVNDNVNNNVDEKVKLNKISFEKNTVKLGDKVNINFDTNKKLKSLKLVFDSPSKQQLVVYVQSLYNNPYFEISSTVVPDTYSLSSATLVADDSTVIFSNNKNDSSLDYFDFNLSLEITNNSVDNNKLVYNNDDITSDIITNIYNSANNSMITINASSNPIINKELFNAIKGTDKKLIINYNDNKVIFSGKDISSSKTIDVSISVNLVNDNSDINNAIDNGVVVNFASNGNLPGKATILVTLSEEMMNIVGNDKIFVYYYNENSKKFTLIDSNVKKNSDGYYEFNISHNSSYVLINNELDKSLVIENIDDDHVVSFQKSNKVNLLLIAVGGALVILISVIIIVLKKNNNKF